MSPAAQHLALAELDGWVRGDDCEIAYGSGRLFPRWYRGNEGAHLGELPEYLEDLNVIHALENRLLGGLTTDAATFGSLCFRYSHLVYSIVVPLKQQPFRATAAQRGEALLRLMERWDDSL